MEEIRGGLCLDITCTATCSELSQPTSMNSSTCTVCGNGTDTIVEKRAKAEYDEANGDCTCNNPLPFSRSSSIPVSNRKLIEIYHPETGDPVGKECMQCPENAAVITENLLKPGEQYYSTAGLKIFPNSYECVYCPDPNMYFDTDYECKCVDNFMVVGEASIGPQKCLKHSPTIFSDYHKVQFPFVRERSDSKEVKQITLNSIVFSHYYLEAASQCEFPSASSLERSFDACQTLANLCVMTYYDDTSIPCRQFQFIAKKRMTNYHSQNDWKIVMPWLYYTDEVDNIINDRGIEMTMSLNEQEGYEQKMKFKLVKYRMNGQFVGIEDLTNQLEYCITTEQDDTGLTFGHSFTHEFQCNFESIIKRDMFFYDMYLVDMYCDDSTNGNNCLYPVPVLNRNYLEKSHFLPNRNQFFGDEINDKYSRRFFLFDNLVSLQQYF